MRADEVLFDAIVSNILENVADHTPPGTPVRIGIAQGGAGRVRISIEDGGPGVAPADTTSAPVEGWASACRSSGA